MVEEKLKVLFEHTFDCKVNSFFQLPQSGSYRRYFLMEGCQKRVLGAYNEDVRENEAFFHFTENFLSKGFNVPEIYAIDQSRKFYLLEYLGDTTLYNYLKTNGLQETAVYYEQALERLIDLQIDGLKGLDLNKCYPRAEFDSQSMLWDLNYFKYFVLKLGKIPFDEQKLEDDFRKLTVFLSSADNNFFLYRDFQSANIMIKNQKVYFIDYQGGRKGAFYYDLASLVYDGKADLPYEIRSHFEDFYFSVLSKRIRIERKEFDRYYPYFVLLRLLQAFAAYTFRGLVEHKFRFVQSIPKAIENLKFLLEKKDFCLDLPHLFKILEHLVYKSEFAEEEDFSGITVRINSFSYRFGSYPEDEAGNGGGFVFDCRFLPNPGRFEKYKNQTGLDVEVKKFLEGKPEVEDFLVQILKIVKKALQNYKQKGYETLQINFGCTGGQHRSVYCAQTFARMLSSLTNAKIIVKHLQLDKIFYF